MTNICSLDMLLLDDIFEMHGGYVLNFSDRTFARFFAEELNIDIDDPRYAKNGTSKGKRLRCFLQTVDKPTVIRTLNALWNIRRNTRRTTGPCWCRTPGRLPRWATTNPDDIRRSSIAKKFAHSARSRFGWVGLQVDQKFNDAAAVGTTINVIPKKNKLGRIGPSIQLALVYQVLKADQAPMNIANGVSAEHLLSDAGTI